MGKFLLVAAAFALAACATPQERAAQIQADVDRMIVTYGPGCERLGYKPNEDKWRDCVLRLSARDERRYHSRPLYSTCFGHRGFWNCAAF